MSDPLAIDLFSGLGGWTEGLLEQQYRVIGFDIERHVYGDQKYPAQLVLQDVLTIHGSQFKDAALIVASPPCQEFSYMAMPWKRGKQIVAALRGKGEFPKGYKGSRTLSDLTALFDACFRIQREACDAAGRYIPMVVENVKGAQPWVGKARAHYGSFYLWGDVDMVDGRIVIGDDWWGGGGLPASDKARKANPDGRKVPGMNFHEHAKTGKPGRSFQGAAVDAMNREDKGDEQIVRGVLRNKAVGAQVLREEPLRLPGVPGLGKAHRETKDREGGKGTGGERFPDAGIDGVKVASRSGRRTDVGNGVRFTSRDCGIEGNKGMSGLRGMSRPNGGGRDLGGPNDPRRFNSRSSARKAASAQIAKIPFSLSSYIARVYRPQPLTLTPPATPGRRQV